MKSAPGWNSGALIFGSVVLSVCEKGWLGQIRGDCAYSGPQRHSVSTVTPPSPS